MKKFNTTFRVIKWYNGGKSEHTIIKVVEAKTLKSAYNKARKMESFGKARTWYLLQNIEEF